MCLREALSPPSRSLPSLSRADVSRAQTNATSCRTLSSSREYREFRVREGARRQTNQSPTRRFLRGNRIFLLMMADFFSANKERRSPTAALEIDRSSSLARNAVCLSALYRVKLRDVVGAFDLLTRLTYV